MKRNRSNIPPIFNSDGHRKVRRDYNYFHTWSTNNLDVWRTLKYLLMFLVQMYTYGVIIIVGSMDCNLAIIIILIIEDIQVNLTEQMIHLREEPNGVILVALSVQMDIEKTFYRITCAKCNYLKCEVQSLNTFLTIWAKVENLFRWFSEDDRMWNNKHPLQRTNLKV